MKQLIKKQKVGRLTSKVVVSEATKLTCPIKIHPIQNAVKPAIHVNNARVRFCEIIHD
jgi:hypothetical protein